jgi:hypothetical protein
MCNITPLALAAGGFTASLPALPQPNSAWRAWQASITECHCGEQIFESVLTDLENAMHTAAGCLSAP